MLEMVRNNHAVKVIKVFSDLNTIKARLPKHGFDRRTLIKANFHHHHPGPCEIVYGVLRNDPIGRKAVRATIERQSRIEVLNLRIKGVEHGGGDIGRIGDDEIDYNVLCRQWLEPAALVKGDPLLNPVPFGIVPRCDKRLAAQIHRNGPNIPAVHQHRDRNASRTGAQVEQLSALWKLCDGHVDQELGFRPRLERRGVERKTKPVEFALTNDPGHRFAREATAKQCFHMGNLLRADRIMFSCSHLNGRAAERVGRQEFGVERCRRNAAPRELVAPKPPQRAERPAQLTLSMAASCSAWDSVISASISSSSASPVITFSSL